MTNLYTYQFVYLPFRQTTLYPCCLPNRKFCLWSGSQLGYAEIKKLFSTVVKYKAKFANGVISSFEDYDDNQVGCFFHLFQFYYIFTKFNWYVCHVGLSLGSPLVCSSVSPSRRSKFPTKRRPTKKNLFTPITRSLFKLLVERTDIALLDVRFQGSML